MMSSQNNNKSGSQTIVQKCVPQHIKTVSLLSFDKKWWQEVHAYRNVIIVPSWMYLLAWMQYQQQLDSFWEEKENGELCGLGFQAQQGITTLETSYFCGMAKIITIHN